MRVALSILVGLSATVDGFRVAVCAWRAATAEADEVALEKPLSCPPPPTRVLEVVDLSD